MAQSVSLVPHLTLLFHVGEEDRLLVGVQLLADVAGKTPEVGGKPQKVTLGNFLLQLRGLEFHPREMFDNLLNVVEIDVGWDVDLEDSVGVLGKMLTFI